MAVWHFQSCAVNSWVSLPVYLPIAPRVRAIQYFPYSGLKCFNIKHMCLIFSETGLMNLKGRKVRCRWKFRVLLFLVLCGHRVNSLKRIEYTSKVCWGGKKKHVKMPKKKTGQRKKAEKQRERQRAIRTANTGRPIAERPCNASMVGNILKSVEPRWNWSGSIYIDLDLPVDVYRSDPL